MKKKKQKIKDNKGIQKFLAICGFARISYNGTFCEYHKEIKGDDIYDYQINGLDISDIDTIDEPCIFSENGIEPSETPMYRYSQEYPDFRSMIKGESKRGVDFSKGLKKYLLP